MFVLNGNLFEYILFNPCFLDAGICPWIEDDCHPVFGICEDTALGKYKCSCRGGYEGDGKTCTGLYVKMVSCQFSTPTARYSL